MIYETDIMTTSQANGFQVWFDNEIGTDIERNEIGDDEVYFVVSEITPKEWSRCSTILRFIVHYSRFMKVDNVETLTNSKDD